MIAMKIVYIANIFLAGWISISSLFYPQIAVGSVFEHNFAYSESIRLVGALWFAIFILSILGLCFPQQMSLVLLFQLIYKSSWLIFAALPAIINQQAYPKGMATCFLVWVLVLPFVIPWKFIFGASPELTF